MYHLFEQLIQHEAYLKKVADQIKAEKLRKLRLQNKGQLILITRKK